MASKGFVVSLKNNKRSSALKIKGGALGKVFTSPVSNGSIALFGNIMIADKDIYAPVVCTDNFRALYSFGKDFGSCTIAGTVFLGSCKGGTGKALGQLVSAFESDRLSKKKKPLRVSIAGTGAWPVYPVSLELTHADPARNSIDFAITCVLATSAS